jgi:ribosomal protein S18 acetylase RimI-like enzyme
MWEEVAAVNALPPPPLRPDPVLKRPSEFSTAEFVDFETLVRRGFDGSDGGLPARLRRANLLAYQAGTEGEWVGIAALKRPHPAYVREVARGTGFDLTRTQGELELGWVFVIPSHRRRGVARQLCTRLLGRVEGRAVFATTRSDNGAMKEMLEALGFLRVGRPFSRRREALVLFVRPGEAGRSGPASPEAKVGG